MAPGTLELAVVVAFHGATKGCALSPMVTRAFEYSIEIKRPVFFVYVPLLGERANQKCEIWIDGRETLEQNEERAYYTIKGLRA
jgi:hypothetical protein